MDLSISNRDFLNAFDHIEKKFLDDFKKNRIELFVLKTNANEFDYNSLEKFLLEPLADYSLSRRVKHSYKGKPMELSKKAREKFIEYLNNKGELGELLLFCFLESHLKAPKILSKLELKTSTKHYVNGADGVHFLKLKDGNYQLIFGESKTVKDLTSAISEAFKSIYEFKTERNTKGKPKSGLRYEKGLISDHLFKESFSETEMSFIEDIIYPKKENDFNVDDAFGIFVGYEMTITTAEKKLQNSEFRELIKNKIKDEIEKKIEHVNKKIKEYKLEGHNFYLYILPFTNLDKTRKQILKSITS